MLLLLVQNDHTQVPAGRKHRRAGPDRHPGLSRPDSLPLIIPLAGGQAAVKHRHLPAEMSGQQAEKLGRQGNLRHQQQRRLPQIQASGNQLQVHGGLAAARHAVQKRHPRRVRLQLFRQRLIGRRLGRIQHQRSVQLCRDNLPAAEHRPVLQMHIAQLLQPPHRRGSGSGVIAQLLDGTRTHRAQQLQNSRLDRSGLFLPTGIVHGFLCTIGENRKALGLISGSAQEVGLGRNPLFIQQIPQGALELPVIREGPSQGAVGSRAAQVLQKTQNGGGFRLPDALLRPGPTGSQGKGILNLKPQAHRQNRPNSLIKGAKIPLPYKSSQAEHGVVQHRLLVQHTVYAL